MSNVLDAISEKKKKLIGYTCGFVAVLFWALPPVLGRYLGTQGVDTFLVAGLRLYIGSFFLFVVLGLTRLLGFGSREPLRYTFFFWLITLGLGLNFLFFHKGLALTLASDAILLESYAPVLVLILIILFLPERIAHLQQKKIVKKVLFLIFLGSVGASFIFIDVPSSPPLDPHSKFIGDLLEFGAMAFWALFLLGSHEYQKREHLQNNVATTAHFLFFAALLVTPFVPWYEIQNIETTQWIWIFILSIFGTSVTYGLWHLASRYLDVVPLMMLFNFTIPTSMALEAIFLDLNISWKLLLGGMLILLAAIQGDLINTKYKLLKMKEKGG